MGVSATVFGRLPDPGASRTVDDLVDALRALKVWAGDPSHETIKDRVNAAWTRAGRPASELTKKTTVVDCFRRGRRRLSTDLVVAVVAALHPDTGYVGQWRQALRVVGGETGAGSQVRARDRLPADLAEFTGRGAELDRLRQMLRRCDGGEAAAVVVIAGMAGVGKTRLAVHAGHVVAGEEPFQQVLFVDLRGFHPDATQPPADPGAVLESFLRLLGVSGRRIPHGVDARAELYRRALAGVRALVVLDNAAGEEQVRPLLPGGGCVTLVTSRRRLAGLSPVTYLAVDAFTAEESRDFLVRSVPGLPVGEDPDALRRVARRCGHLPLALGLLAGHMRAAAGWTLTDHADRLDEHHRNRRLDGAVDVALGVSYKHLLPGRRRLLRLLALHPGHDIEANAAAAFIGTDLDAARDGLRQLSSDHLLQHTGCGRYVMHDLVRAYAADRSVDEDRPAERHAALTRLFDHYLHAAAEADAVEPTGQGRRWLDSERVNLIAAAGHAAEHGWPRYAVRLATVLSRYLRYGAHYTDGIALHTDAHRAAWRIGDRVAAARARADLGDVHWGHSRFAAAATSFQQALATYRELGDRRGQARALRSLGTILMCQSRYPQALDCGRRALDLYVDLGDHRGQARTLTTLGLVHRRLGHAPQAAEHAERALVLLRAVGDRPGEAAALNVLGLAYDRLGCHVQATECLQQALSMFRQLGHRAYEAHMLTHLGVVYRRRARFGHAIDLHRRAVNLFRQLGDDGGRAEALNDLGETLLTSGRADHAQRQHSSALVLATRVGDRHERARAHDGLAHAHHTADNLDVARVQWRQALAIYAELGVPEADEIRTHLAASEPPEHSLSSPELT